MLICEIISWLSLYINFCVHLDFFKLSGEENIIWSFKYVFSNFLSKGMQTSIEQQYLTQCWLPRPSLEPGSDPSLLGSCRARWMVITSRCFLEGVSHRLAFRVTPFKQVFVYSPKLCFSLSSFCSQHLGGGVCLVYFLMSSYQKNHFDIWSSSLPSSKSVATEIVNSWTQFLGSQYDFSSR